MNYTEPIDRLHRECMIAQREIRSDFTTARHKAAEWTLPLCPPPTPLRRMVKPLTKQQAAWFNQPFDPRALVRPDLADAIYGDDPLLVSSRPWFR